MAAINLCEELFNKSDDGNLQRVRELLDLGADPNEVYTIDNEIYDHGITCLMQAAMSGHIQIVEELINCGADLDATNRHRYTALMLTAWNIQSKDVGVEERTTHVDVAKLLIRSGCSVDTDKKGYTIFDILPKEMRVEMEEYIDSLVPKPAKKEKDC